MFSYVLHPAARKELGRFPFEIQKQIVKKIAALCQLDHPILSPNVIKLKGREDSYRLRVGDYRVKFILRKPNLLLIIAVDHRQVGY
ncbi:MAG: type II toxin-antitoxin system RelE/ParE family toxin [bacterium]|nr:type II toxin-antitoxin system RelE/ParE family toxin [bacterium]